MDHPLIAALGGKNGCLPTSWHMAAFGTVRSTGATAQGSLRNEKARGSNPLSSTHDALSDLRKRRRLDRVSCHVTPARRISS